MAKFTTEVRRRIHDMKANKFTVKQICDILMSENIKISERQIYRILKEPYNSTKEIESDCNESIIQENFEQFDKFEKEEKPEKIIEISMTKEIEPDEVFKEVGSDIDLISEKVARLAKEMEKEIEQKNEANLVKIEEEKALEEGGLGNEFLVLKRSSGETRSRVPVGCSYEHLLPTRNIDENLSNSCKNSQEEITPNSEQKPEIDMSKVMTAILKMSEENKRVNDIIVKNNLGTNELSLNKRKYKKHDYEKIKKYDVSSLSKEDIKYRNRLLEQIRGYLKKFADDPHIMVIAGGDPEFFSAELFAYDIQTLEVIFEDIESSILVGNSFIVIKQLFERSVLLFEYISSFLLNTEMTGMLADVQSVFTETDLKILAIRLSDVEAFKDPAYKFFIGLMYAFINKLVQSRAIERLGKFQTVAMWIYNTVRSLYGKVSGW